MLLAGAAYRTSVKLADGGQEQNRGNASNKQSNNGQIVVLPAIEQENQPIQERSVMDGQVISVSNRGLSVQLTDGQGLEIFGRAWRYAQSSGFTAQASDPVSLEGFYEDGAFQTAHITNLRNAQSVFLRDDSGHPLWSGSQ